MGHALNHTLQDVLIRFQRMRGRDALWQPGTDHAGIATQMVVERQLAAQQQNRHQMGREAFVERVWQWRSEEHTSELQSLMRISYAVFCLKKKKQHILYNSKHSST